MARREAGVLFHIVNDHLGTPKEMFSEGGALAWAVDHDTWGTLRHVAGARVSGGDAGDYWVENVAYQRSEASAEPAASLCPIRFQGQWEDAETGLYYNRFRYYEPLAGQYASPDPIGIYGGINFYSYSISPNTWIDVYGLANCWTAKHPDIFVSPNGGPIFGDSHLFQQDGILNTVTIALTGSRGTDFSNANDAAGIPRTGTPRGYTWHHVDDYDPVSGTSTMQLVKSHIHEDTLPHSGSVSQFEALTRTRYESDAARAASRCCRTQARIGKINCRG